MKNEDKSIRVRSGAYVGVIDGRDNVRLDGDFTADELRTIADAMDNWDKTDAEVDADDDTIPAGESKLVKAINRLTRIDTANMGSAPEFTPTREPLTAAVTAERDKWKHKASHYHRRAQQAEAALVKIRKDWDKHGGPSGGNFGRAALAVLFRKCEAERDALLQDKARLEKRAYLTVSLCCFPRKEEAEFTYENADGEKVAFTLKMPKEIMQDVASVIGPCVYYEAAIEVEKEVSRTAYSRRD